MTDFFDTLERELQSAASRPPRRLAGWSTAAQRGLVGAFALVALAAALIPAFVIFGSGEDQAEQADKPEQSAVGTVIRKGEGDPPRQADSTIVATGRTPIAGPWQIESYRGPGLKDPKTGAVYEPAGLRCLQIVLTDAPPSTPSVISGACGESSRTPGFTRLQKTVPTRQAGRPIDPRTTEILVYGRVPEQAVGVDLRLPDRPPERFETFEGPPGERGDFYLLTVPPDVLSAELPRPGGAFVDWIPPGARGRGDTIRLLPP